jgi:hypothetical protein
VTETANCQLPISDWLLEGGFGFYEAAVIELDFQIGNRQSAIGN